MNPNPVALALLGKMGYAPQDKVKIKLEFLLMLIQLQLDPARQKLVHGIFEKYHKLSAEEELQLNEDLRQIPKDEVNHIMELMTSWEKKGFVKGIEEGMEKVAKLMLVKDFSIHDICEITGLTAAEVEKLKSSVD